VRLAAQLWADLRNRGLPTSNPEELDIDVILAAQALMSGFPAAELIVVTSNPAHLSRLITADHWTNI
jgi:hypothetical protein